MMKLNSKEIVRHTGQAGNRSHLRIISKYDEVKRAINFSRYRFRFLTLDRLCDLSELQLSNLRNGDNVYFVVLRIKVIIYQLLSRELGTQ